MIQTYMEAEHAGEGERLALMVGEGLRHPTFQLQVAPIDNYWAVELTGTNLVLKVETAEQACSAFNTFAVELAQLCEYCLECGGGVVRQKGTFTRDMTSGEVLEVMQIQSERCHLCGSPHLSYKNK